MRLIFTQLIIFFVLISISSPSALAQQNQITPAAEAESWNLIISMGGLALLLIPLLVALLVRRFRQRIIRAALLKRSSMRLLGVFLLTAYLAIISGFAALSLQQIETNLRQETANHLVAVTASTEKALDLWGRSILREVHHISTEAELFDVITTATTNPTYANRLFQQYYGPVQQSMAALNLFIVNEDGHAIAQLNSINVDIWQSASKLDLLRQSQNQPTVYVPPNVNIGTKNSSSFHFVSAINKPDMAPYYVVASFDCISTFAPFTELARTSHSGESYVIDIYGRMLSGSRFIASLQQQSHRYPQFAQPVGWLVRDPGRDLLSNTDISIELEQRPLTLMAQQATQRQSGFNVQGYRDYRGVMVFGAWRWSNELQLAIATEIDITEALAPYYKTRQVVIGALISIAIVTFLLMGIILWLGERVSSNLRQLVEQSNEKLSTALTKLEASEFTRSLALDSAQIGLWFVDIKSRRWWWDQRSTDMLGVAVSENGLSTLANVIHPQDHDALWQQFQTSLANRSTFDVEFRVIRPNGDSRYIRARASANETARLGLRVDGILLDVSQIKVAEQNARQALERNQLILNYAGEGIVGLDKDGNISFCNAAAQRMLGYTETELVGQNMHKLVHYAHADGSTYPASSCPMQLAMQHGVTTSIDTDVLWHKSGRAFPVDYTAVPLQQNNALVGSVVVFRDMTERKENEHKLRAREKQITTLLDASPDPLIITDDKARIVSVNQRTEQVFKYQREMLIGENIEILIPPRFRNGHVTMRDGFIQQPKPRLFGQTMSGADLIAITSDGHEFPIELSLNPIETDEGLFIVSAIHDLTERKQAEQLLKAEREQLQTILDVSPIGVGFTVGGILKFANPKFLAMSNAQLDKPIKQIYVDLKARDDILDLVNREHKTLNIETQMFGADGSIRDILVSYLPVQFQGETGLLGWLLDITERKRIEARISDSEARLQAAALAANLGLWDYNPQNKELLTNSIWVTMFGYNADTWLEAVAEFDGKWLRLKGGMDSWASLIHPDDLQAVSTLFYSQLAGKSDIFRGEYRVKCADNSWRWVLVAGQVIERDTTGKALRMVGILSDISEEKLLQHELITARDQAEEATRTKSDFLANMSHEIRTPMNAILGMSHLALQTELNRKQRNYIEKVQQSAASLLGIINDILDFSKIEAGRLTIEQVEFRLEDVLDNLATMISFKAENKGLELLFDVPGDIPVALIGDPLRLGQILINLGNNAVKFTQTGEVVVAVRLLKQSSKQCQLEFTVRDTGIGLSDEQQSRLFRSFSQADSSTTRRFGGTGLGLAISKNLVELMGGKIWLESELGVGSTFGFQLSFDIQDLPQPVVRSEVTELEGIRVLVVDDNRTAGEILTLMLQSMQFRVDYVSSGSAALTALEMANQDDPYKLLLMDWKMPEMDGIELARQIEANNQLIDTPRIILVTAYSRDDALAAAKNLKIESFLNKPVTPSSLLDAVMLAIGREIISDSRLQLKHSDTRYALDKLCGARILLVEDNEVNQELASELLQENGMSVSLAINGKVALDMLDTQEFDGILMDCQMPVMDGYTATRLIRQQQRFESLPIIAMTANAMAGDREAVLAAGMNDHIPKPINVNEMFDVMARWITPKVTRVAINKTPSVPDDSATPLPDLAGIDTEQGLLRTQNRPALYRRLLLKVLHNHADFPQQYAKAKSDRDTDKQRMLVHSLKGVMANIGAMALANCCQQLEDALTKAAPTERAESELLQQFEAVFTALTQFKASSLADNVAVKTDVDISAAQQIVSQLITLATNFDTEVITLFEQHTALLEAVAGTSLHSNLLSALGRYDFDAALKLLTTVQQHLMEPDND